MMKTAIKLVLTIGLMGALSLGTPAQIVYAATQLPVDDRIDKVSELDSEVNDVKEALGEKSDRTRKAKNDRSVTFNQISEYSKNIYNLVKFQNWESAKANLVLLTEAVQRIKPEMGMSRAELAQLNSIVPALEATIAAQNHQAMCDANQFAMLATKLAMQSQPQMPVEVAMLDYYGRELEIWSANGNTGQLKKIAANIRQTWNALKPSVRIRSGSAQLQQFDNGLVALIETADSPTEYNLLAKSLLSEVSNLQTIFHS